MKILEKEASQKYRHGKAKFHWNTTDLLESLRDLREIAFPADYIQRTP
jgi:hypothetical protein